MDIYRQMFAGERCHSNKYWQEIRKAGRPKIDFTRLKDLYYREHTLFYPKREVENILKNEEAIDHILACRESCCKKHLVMAETERRMIVDSVLDRGRPKIILLAILICLGRSFMIAKLSKVDNLYDGALGNLYNTSSNGDSTYSKMWSAFLELPLEDGRLSAAAKEQRDGFLENYTFLTNLFDAPVFSTQNSWVTDYPEDKRLPFLDDELHWEGTDTVIRKFNIHDQYLVVDQKYAMKDWYRAETTHRFARKILRRGGPDDRLQRRLEMNSLRAMSAQDHDNIIELLFVFEWRDQFSFVFPYVAHDLRAVLHGKWQPVSANSSSSVPLEQHWLWTQMTHVASGLKTIHHPDKPVPLFGTNSPVHGFHFDLKPANILVTDSGVLKITDFGQAIFKYADVEGSTYGLHRGGSLIYQPPEAAFFPRTIEISELSHQSRRYDVWSLACIMFEVLKYVLAGGPDEGKGKSAVEAFEKARKHEDGGEAYYTYASSRQGELKGCIRRELKYLSSKPQAFNADKTYLRGVASLLEKMFTVNPKFRPTSSEVHKELEDLSGQLPCIRHNMDQIESLMKLYPVPRNFEEVGWSNHGWRGNRINGMNGVVELRSFIYMTQVRLLEKPTSIGPRTAGQPCNIRVQYSKQEERFAVDTFLDGRKIGSEFHLSSARYFPMYKFASSSIEPLQCALRDSGSSIIWSFSSHDLLKNFQSTVTQHQIIDGSMSTLESVTIQRVGIDTSDIANKGNIEAQLWVSKKPGRLFNTSSRSKSQSIIRIIVFDCANREIINIPLDHQTSLPDVSNNIKRTHPECFTILPNRRFQHSSFPFSVSKADGDALGPSLPLSRNSFEEMERKGKAKSVDLKFRNAQAMNNFASLLLRSV